MTAGLISTHPIKALTLFQPRTEVDQLNRWMFDRMIGYASGEVLELGSGSGKISDLFIERGIPISLSDPDRDCCRKLRDKYWGDVLVKDTRQINLLHENFSEEYASLLNHFQMVVGLNIEEYVFQNHLMIGNARRLVASGGYLVLLLHGFAALYQELNQGLTLWHKYNKMCLIRLLSLNFQIVKTRYFNLNGIVEQSLLTTDPGNVKCPAGRNNVYRSLVPSFYVGDFAFKQKGLSVMVIAQKKSDLKNNK